MSDGEVDDKKGVVQLTARDYGRIVTYLENKANFVAICGSSKKTPVSGKPMISKIAAFAKMATYLHKHSTTPNLPLLTGRNMQQRFETYYNKFKATLKESQKNTGAGLTKAEIAKGLSLPAKWEKMCPHFSRMAALFKGRSNISPPATSELGMPKRYKPPSMAQKATEEIERDYLPNDLNVVSSESESEPIGAAQEEGQEEYAIESVRSVQHKNREEHKHAGGEGNDFLGQLVMMNDESAGDDAGEEHAASAALDKDNDKEDCDFGDVDIPDPATCAASIPQPNNARLARKRKTQEASDNCNRLNTKCANPIAAKNAQSKQHNKKMTDAEEDIGSADEKGAPVMERKKETAKESRLSLAQSYSRNMSQKLNHLQEKMEVAKARLAAKSSEAERQREYDAAQREIDRNERRDEKKRDVLIALINSRKSADEIDRFMKYF